MEYNKLVRDKIPEIIKESGKKPVTHVATDLEYERLLINKLTEEVNEFLQDQTTEEIADIMEVIYALCALKGIDLVNLERLRQEKADKRGGFKKKIILERVDH